MTRKKRTVVDKFVDNINEMIATHVHLMTIAQRDQRRTTVENMLVEQFLLSIAVKWESFVNDVVVSLIEDQPSRFRTDWKKRVAQSLSDKFGACSTKFVRVEFPDNLTKALIELMLNPRGDNISQTTSEKLQSKTASILDAKYARRFSLETKHRLIIDYFVALRNYLAHKSKRSRLSLVLAQRQAMAEPALDWLGGQIDNIGRYLRTPGPSGKSVAVAIAESVVSVAQKFK